MIQSFLFNKIYSDVLLIKDMDALIILHIV